MYNRDGLLKLVAKQRWQIAISFVGSDAVLQQLLLDHMLAAGALEHARIVAQRLGLADFAPDVAQLASQAASWTLHGVAHSAHAAALHGYLDLPLPPDAVVFCDSEALVREAMRHFFGSDAAANGDEDVKESDANWRLQCPNTCDVVGLDVEWKPTTSKIAAATGSLTTTAVASILQIASPTRVFLLDLLALHVRPLSGA